MRASLWTYLCFLDTSAQYEPTPPMVTRMVDGKRVTMPDFQAELDGGFLDAMHAGLRPRTLFDLQSIERRVGDLSKATIVMDSMELYNAPKPKAKGYRNPPVR